MNAQRMKARRARERIRRRTSDTELAELLAGIACIVFAIAIASAYVAQALHII